VKSKPTTEFTVRGSGPIGPYWAPIPYSWPNRGRRGAARRGAQRTKHWRLLSSITGRIDIYLKSGQKETPEGGAAAWFADNLGLFTKQTEKYSAKEFLRRYSRFLNENHHRSVLLTEIDYEPVYVAKTSRGDDDFDEAIAKASEYLESHEDSNKVLLSTFGRAGSMLKGDLNFTLEAQYNRKHGHGKPGLEIRVLGIPRILLRKPREDDKDYKARMKRFFQALSDLKKEKFAMRCENAAKVLLKDYERQLYKYFDVARSTRWLHLRWGRTGDDLTPRVKF
jgi:hypothetical protein